MSPLTRELAVYSLQIALVVATCAAAVRASGFAHPQARLAGWRLVLAACLLLPLWPAQVVRVTVPVAREIASAVPATGGGSATPAAALLASPSNAGTSGPSSTLGMLLNLLPLLIAAGAVARASWLAAGLLSLRRLAASEGGAVDTPELLELHARIGSNATLRWHDSIEQPVAFGWRRPAVLLPASLKDKPLDVQSAALSHELLHVARQDWLTGLIEQAVLCTFWFHPAVWWIVDQMELCREQIVDDLSIAAVGSKKNYLRALLEFADKPSPSVVLAFGHRQLARRIQHLSREIVMTPSRFVLSTAALTIVMSASVFAVASALPIRTETQYHVLAVRSSDDQTRASASAPVSVAKPDAQAATVSDRPGPPPSPAQAHGSVSDEHNILTTFQEVSAQTQALAAKFRAADAMSFLSARTVYPEQARKNSVGASITMTATITTAGQVVDIKTASWSLTIDRDITDVAYWAASPQQAFVDACTDALGQWQVSPPYAEETLVRVAFQFRPPGSVLVNVDRRTWDGRYLEAGAQSFATGREVRQPDEPILRVGGDIRTPRKLENTDPVYPKVALDGGVAGVVIIEVTIGADGSVTDARIVRSVPLLDEAALDAVKQWKYEPTIKDGVAIPVRMTVTVNFSLRK